MKALKTSLMLIEMVNSTGDRSGKGWKEPFAFGIWTFKDPNVEEYEGDEAPRRPSQIRLLPEF